MKRFLLALLVSAGWFLLGMPSLAAESGSPEPAVVPSAPAAIPETGKAPSNKEKSVKAKRKKPKPFTAEDVKRAQATKKKVEWWEMPKPPVYEPGSSVGRSHLGH